MQQTMPVARRNGKSALASSAEQLASKSAGAAVQAANQNVEALRQRQQRNALATLGVKPFGSSAGVGRSFGFK